jgi:hypothetical protein
MGRKKLITEKEAIKLIITSKKMAELFIERWMERHGESREEAIEKLKQLEIDISQLPD